ncbi:MAG: hypothetical protein ABIF04_01700 [Chloroflexota bacterium]
MNSNLINRYLAELGKHLPLKNRADIQKEIRSILEDMLEECSRKAGRLADEELVVALLKEYGKPEDVAASYLPERTLIGPQLYPIFSLVAWVALSVLGIVLLITMSIGSFSTSQTPVEMLETAFALLLKIGGALVTAFGSIVITFAIMERIPWSRGEFRKEKEDESKAWNPRDLPEVQDVEKFSIPGLVAEIVFTGIALVVFNFFSQVFSLGITFQNSEWTFLPLLSEAFFRYLPYINGLWILQIVLNLILLRQGRWQTATRWMRFALLALGIVLAAFMLTGPDLVVSNAEAIRAASPKLSVEAARILTLLPRILVKVALGLSILTNSVELLKSLFREVTGKM